MKRCFLCRKSLMGQCTRAGTFCEYLTSHRYGMANIIFLRTMKTLLHIYTTALLLLIIHRSPKYTTMELTTLYSWGCMTYSECKCIRATMMILIHLTLTLTLGLVHVASMVLPHSDNNNTSKERSNSKHPGLPNA